MARTKQTARKAMVNKAPRKHLAAQRVARLSQPYPVAGLPQAEESEELQDFVNTQQFSLKFDDQDKCQKQAVETPMHACKTCDAYLTVQSTIISKDQYKVKKEDKSLSDIQRQKYLENYEKVWICEFCLTHNSIPLAYEPPKQQNPCIILQKVVAKKKGAEEGNVKVLIFCIDISGSMDMSFEGKTRLESVKEAITDQVNRLNYEKQKIKIGLITFGNEVCLIGDGSAFKRQILPTQLYKNFDGVVRHLEKVNNFCYPLDKSYKDLKKTISELGVHGSTALGPGLLSAIELSSKGTVGSKVILCTDGEANVGMGSCFNDDRFTFYEKLAEHAKQKKVMVNILSLKGDKCNLKELGKLSLATGGAILKIDPKMLGTQFTKIVKQNVIGTESKLVIKLNKIFRICNGKADQVSKDQTTITQNFGNFTQQTQLNFQFDTVAKEEAEKIPEIDLGLYASKRVPMQIQLTYTGRNSWRYMQIVTDWRELTENLNDIYEGANFSLFAASVLQRASAKIREGLFPQAESILKGYWSIVNQKFSKTQSKQILQKFAQRIQRIERVLKSRKQKKNPKSSSIPKAGTGKGGRSQRGGRGRGRGRGRGGNMRQRSLSRSRSRSRSASVMNSESEQQVLYKQIRARERSRSQQKKRSRSRSRSRSVQKRKDRSKSPDRSRQKPGRRGRK